MGVTVMIYAVTPAVRNRILTMVREHTPRPTELLTLLQHELSYRDVQDALSELLDNGEIVLDSERHLRVPPVAA